MKPNESQESSFNILDQEALSEKSEKMAIERVTRTQCARFDESKRRRLNFAPFASARKHLAFELIFAKSNIVLCRKINPTTFVNFILHL